VSHQVIRPERKEGSFYPRDLTCWGVCAPGQFHRQALSTNDWLVMMKLSVIIPVYDEELDEIANQWGEYPRIGQPNHFDLLIQRANPGRVGVSFVQSEFESHCVS
jgi:hypothetical protein